MHRCGCVIKFKASMASSPSRGVGLGVPDDEQLRAEVDAVLSSESFRRSPKISRLLRYLCDKQFNGQAGDITEYAIALEVLGRDAQFDPQQDAVVRVDAHHLRKKLKEYYRGEGAAHDFQIVVPGGQYAPQFVQRLDPAPPAAEPVENQALHRPDSAKSRWNSAKSRWKGWMWLAVLIPAVLAALWAVPRYRPTRTAATPIVAPAEANGIRIAVGRTVESYIDTAGRAWSPDRFFTGGGTFHRSGVAIQRTYDPDLFQSGREGQFSYAIPLRPGIYELHLYLAETGVASDTLRAINVSINGQPRPAIDVASDAGGINTATMKIFNDISPAKDGFLHLAFGGPSPSFLNAIEIVPGIAGKMLPVRMTARDGAYRDHLGQIWLPEQWASGGRKSARPVSVSGTSDVGLYQWERFGHFSYMIPVEEGGLYTVTLHFSETWFTPSTSIGGLGSRVFDVYCNGSTLLKNFDILEDAGGLGNHAVTRVFHHVPASALGKIELTFIPVANYALINAIEITSE